MKALIILGWLWLCPFFSNTTQESNANISVSTLCSDKQKADAILGEWLDEDKTVRIQVVKKENRYQAHIVWLKDGRIAKPGTQVLQGLQYTQANTWQEGRLFYPRTDSWYNCRCTLSNPSIMKIRVYIGTPLLGKTIAFTRVDSAEMAAK